MKQEETEISLPVVRNDEETLEERLTDNAYNKILPGRYLKKTEEGEYIEEPEDLFPRVGRNIALAELVHVDTPIYVKQDHIKPDHPRRDKLLSEVFGDEAGEAKQVLLTEDNVKHISYDAIFPDLSERMQRRVQNYADEFTEAMEHLRFMPNTPTLINAGNELQQLSACFVMNPDDDMEHIHETAKEAALTFQSGGGVGYSFSKLRPYGDSVGSTGGIASGPITFMETFDQMCETIAQGGARRGAQMGIMRVDHPDIIHFIHAKNKDTSLAHTLRLNDPKDYRNNSFSEALEEARSLIITDKNGEEKVPKHLRNAAEGFLSNFNISVAITEEFMNALQDGGDYTFTNPRTGEPHVATEETAEMYGWFGLGDYVESGEVLEIPAEAIWERIVEGAYENGEPGVIYMDRVNDKHSFDVDKHQDHEIISTNPCSEQPLENFEACNLGHINLSTIVEENRTLWKNYDGNINAYLTEVIDWTELNERIEMGTRFLDNVVTMSHFPVEEIEEKVSGMRKIGLGVMGLAQLFIQLGIEYGSDEGDEATRLIMKHINHRSKSISRMLAEERGSFDEWSKSKYANPTEYPEWFQQHVGQDPEEWEDGFPIRNHNTTTVAPTGTTSMVANTSGGVEPIYNVVHYKNVSNDLQGDEQLVEFDSFFLKTLEENNIDVEEVKQEAVELMENNEYEGIHSLSTVPDALAKLFVVTSDLNGKEHASLMCAAQEGVDSAISKTCNFPQDATVEEMDEVYRYIYDNGGKSVTVYRDGSRAKQVLSTNADHQEVDEDPDKFVEEEFGVDMDTIEEALDAMNEPPERQARKVPQKTYGVRYRIRTGYGKLYVNINEDEHGLIEVFATVGKSGGFTESFCEALARMVSLNLRWGVPVAEVIEQLEGIRSPELGWDNGEQVHSIPDGIALALKRHMGREGGDDTLSQASVEEELSQTAEKLAEVVETETDGGVKEVVGNGSNPECDNCGTMLVIQEGCEKCPSCGWSKC